MRPLHSLIIGLSSALLTACSYAAPSPSLIGGEAPSNVGAALEGRNLLYVSTLGDAPLYVYAYPGGKEIGALSGPMGPRGLCVDKSSDIFAPFIYIPGGVYEYAHGSGTPLAYLGLIYDWPNGCSIDPTTGALAVVSGPNHERAAVTVYHYGRKRGWGFATGYSISAMETSDFCGYDDKGDLFVDGRDTSGDFVLVELPRRAKKFVTIALTQGIGAPGQVQWDGKHLAIGDTGVSPSVIYQFDVSGSTATEVGSTTLAGSSTVEQFWIQGGRVVAPDPDRSCGGSQKGCIAFYRYPAGGSATKTIALPSAFGATVSLAP